jgi:N6-adenosine-specific RNA methylase IME4
MQINEAFHNLIPPLSSDEFAQLEQNILADGIREPLVTWNDILIDGHNRYEIAQKHDLPFQTVSKEFVNEDEAKQWIILNQLGRRNIADFVKSELMNVYEDIELQKGKEKYEATVGRPNKSLSIIDNDKSDKHNTQKIIADKLGWSTGKVAMAKIIQDKASDEIKQKLRKGDMSINQAYVGIRRSEVLERIKQKPILPTDKYRIIYADPPWKYGNTMPDDFKEQADHYQLMTMTEICEMPINEITEDNAVLFIWVTSPILEESFQVINSWGFKYKASFVWDKVKHNMGHYNSVRHEFLLIAVKGSCQPDVQKLHDSVVSEERTTHSKKPEIFREIIDEIYPYGKRIELFARIKTKGWETYGNQIS